MIRYVARPVTDEVLELGEGARFDAATGEFDWVDILTGRIFTGRLDELTLTMSIVNRVAVPGHLGAACRSVDGGWIGGRNRDIVHVAASGEVTVLANCAPEGQRFNEGVIDPVGRFVTGTLPYDLADGAAALYRYDRRGAEILFGGVTISNGTAWSADGSTMYYVDTVTHRVDAFDYDTSDGSLHGRRTAFEIDAQLGGPDGMCIDDEGCLWIALWGGGRVVRYSPDGEELADVVVDALQPSSAVLGGSDGRTLLITTATEDMDEPTRAAHPGNGLVFATRVDVPGRPSPRFNPSV